MADEHEPKINRMLSKRDKVIIAICVAILFVCITISAMATAVNKTPKSTSDSSNSAASSNGTIPYLSGTQGADNSSSQQPQTPSCTSYQALDSQTWLEIVKDPDSYDGQCYTVYGEVTQFDSSTGTSGFRANVGGVEETPEYGFVDYPTNTVLTGDASTLSSVVEQDLFTANVLVLGSYTYQTQIGGQTTVPQLQVNSIQVTGTVSD